MPDVLWPIFRANRHVLHDVPALGTAVLQQWVRRRYGANVLLVVILHTFGRDLKFNYHHLHVLVSQSGLSEDEGPWLPELPLDMKAIMKMWWYAVITLLRMAYRWRLLAIELSVLAYEKLLREQYERWWYVYKGMPKDKVRILQYAGRYVRRPPIAAHRILGFDDREVRFLTKDLKSRKTVENRHSLDEFIDRLTNHVPDHYAHNVRYFGLLAPRTKSLLYDFLFHLLGQRRRPKPTRLPWAKALRRYFGVDPLVDSQGNPMRWIGRLAPTA